jgi:LmbE family N-acetylglucosaminyl deacetylase
MKKILVLSPHLDDAVLSCGGWMAQAAQAGERVLVYNLFCAHYQGPLSPAARELHASWGNPADITALRAAEDRQALAALGVEGIYGDARDLIYRQDTCGEWLYPNMADIMGRRNPQDDALVGHYFEKVTALFSVKEVEIYAPLGIGGHIDHLLAFDLGMRLQESGFTVHFYEDLPYALHADWLEKRMEAISGGEAWVKLFTLENLEKKMIALGAYASQIPSLFEDEWKMRESLTAQALRMSGRQDMGGEKVWRIK